MIQANQPHTDQVNSSNRREHQPEAGHTVEKKGPENQTETKEQDQAPKNQAQMAAAARFAETAHQELSGQMAPRGEKERELRTEPDANQGKNADPCGNKDKEAR